MPKKSKKNKQQKPAGSRKPQPAQTNRWPLRRKLLIGVGAAAIIVLIAVLATPPAGPKTYSAPPPMMIDTSKEYTATIHTAKGDLVLELFASDVPVTVNNFVFLAREGFYDGLRFSRVEPGFVVQGGCPIGDRSGGPGYQFDDEITHHRHVKGALSMANSGPNTNGSQFFITMDDWPHLDGTYSVFGRLVEGMEVLEQIKVGDVMIRVTIHD